VSRCLAGEERVAGAGRGRLAHAMTHVGDTRDPGAIAITHSPPLLAGEREKTATLARPGRNPITGETITIAAKPKRTVVKAQALKALKEMVK
jgi:hypothetical protein